MPGDIIVMTRTGESANRIAADLAQVQGATTGVRAVEEISAPMRAWLFQFDTAAINQAAMLRAFANHSHPARTEQPRDRRAEHPERCAIQPAMVAPEHPERRGVGYHHWRLDGDG